MSPETTNHPPRETKMSTINDYLNAPTALVPLQQIANMLVCGFNTDNIRAKMDTPEMAPMVSTLRAPGLSLICQFRWMDLWALMDSGDKNGALALIDTLMVRYAWMSQYRNVEAVCDAGRAYAKHGTPWSFKRQTDFSNGVPKAHKNVWAQAV